MYAKCGQYSEAQKLFDRLPVQDVATWNALITGYSRHQQATEVLHCFEKMKSKGFDPNAVTFMCALKACISIGDIDKGIELHVELERKKTLDWDFFLGSVLIDLYAKFGMLARAREVFYELTFPNIAAWTALIAGYVENRHEEEALAVFEEMQNNGFSPGSTCYFWILKACSKLEWIEKGKNLHLEVEREGLLEGDLTICNALIDMYIGCGAISEAQHVFGKLHTRDVASWNLLITGYLGYNCDEQTLMSLKQMQVEGVLPNSITYASSIRACDNIGALEKVKELHAEMSIDGTFNRDMFACCVLVDVYTSRGLFQEAEKLLTSCSTHDLVVYNALASGYANYGLAHEALQCLDQLQLEGFSPDAFTYISMFKVCTAARDLENGKRMHIDAEIRGFLSVHTVIGNVVLNMYAKLGLLMEAQYVFGRLLSKDVVSWNVMLEGYSEYGLREEVLQCFEHMQMEGIVPSSVTFLYILKACSKLGDIPKSIEIHGEIARAGLLENNYTMGSALINMYMGLDLSGVALEVFKSFVHHDIALWKALVAGYVENEFEEEALHCFEVMQRGPISPDAGAYVYALKACSGTGELVKAIEFHHEIIEKGYNEDIAIGNLLIDIYSDFGLLNDAESVFDGLLVRNIVSWNTLVAGYLKYGLPSIALKHLERIQLEGLCFNSVTFACHLNACGLIKATKMGQKIHEEIGVKGFLEDNLSVGTALIDMYGKFGMLAEAQKVFDSHLEHDVGLWNSLISGYLGQMESEKALHCFRQMQLECCFADCGSFVSVLKACAMMQALALGKTLHAMILGSNFLKNDSFISNNLIDMYIKSGSLPDAHRVFDKIPTLDVVAWTSLITGYVEHGYCKAALELYTTMNSLETFPNEVTLLCGLKACRNIGAIAIGLEIHNDIELKGLLDSNLAVGTALVAMYMNCGFFATAQRVFDRIPVQSVVLWNALMSGYGQHGHSGEIFFAFENMLRKGIHPDPDTFAIILSACSRAGLLHKGSLYFNTMCSEFCIKPSLEHHTSMFDLLGRTGALGKAAARIMDLPISDDVARRTILYSCNKWGNIELGMHTFEQMLLSNQCNQC
ncbi:hypothetical protein KP509_29G008100 [Ceratopteris richardii]|nr:hypothetical protein KP509_29G008100 [Ceratopteris richardii]